MAVVTLLIAGVARSQEPVSPGPDENAAKVVRTHFQAGVNAVSERNLFWNFSDTVAPDAGFDPDTEWLEAYIKAGISFEAVMSSGPTVYGKVSGVSSYTVGTDAYDFDDIGSTDLEEMYLRIRYQTMAGIEIDASVGPRELKLGTGMLIANGGSSGFERGAIKFGPRKAWDMTGLFRLKKQQFTATAFFVDPNERPALDQDNRLAGVDVRFDGANKDYVGLTLFKVLNSESPYVQAAPGGVGAPTILDGARDGTEALQLYARFDPRSGNLDNWTMTADVAIERNDRIDLEAWAARFQLIYAFKDAMWSPSLMYSFQTFSGDDPDTPELERFDPLYYEGSPSAWATGSKSSMVFINSNVQAHGITLRAQPSQKDTLTLRVAHIRVNELRSPIQFGQATRVDTTGGTANVVSGVTDKHLSDDVFIEYSRIINRNTFLTAGISVSLPGDGTRSIVNGDVPDWTGFFVNVVVNY